MYKIIYWSGTGNTEKMATYIGEGLNENNIEYKIVEVSHASANDIEEAECIILGCPAMGCEELDDSSMLPYIEQNETLWKEKRIVLFGSYGWGSGEWMETWKEQMSALGAHLLIEPLIVNEFTQGQDEEICKEYGRKI